ILLLTISIFPASAISLFAQPINLSLREVSLETALQEIRKQSDYIVWYEEGILAHTRKVTLSARNIEVEDALKRVFREQPLTYSIVGKTIVVKKKPTTTVTSAQQDLITVSGKVRLMVNGQAEAIAGINVREKGANRMTTSNASGDFSVQVPKGATLVFSMLGYRAREVVVESAAPLNITLQ